ncbi:unnamed protein product [Caenorhabditis nigoni]
MEPPALAAPAENLDPPAQIEPQEQEEEFKPVIMTFYAPDTSDEQPEIPPVTARFATLPEPRHPVRLVSSSPDESSDSSSGYSSSDLSFLERAIARVIKLTSTDFVIHIYGIYCLLLRIDFPPHPHNPPQANARRETPQRDAPRQEAPTVRRGQRALITGPSDRVLRPQNQENGAPPARGRTNRGRLIPEPSDRVLRPRNPRRQ